MKSGLSSPFLAHLASGATTLCVAIRLTRSDSEVFGFTNHVEEIVVDSTTMAVTSCFDASSVEQRADLAPGNLELLAALDSAAITKADLIGGVWDNAYYEYFLVNYSDPAQYGIISEGWIGTVSVLESTATVEARDIASALEARFGEVLSPTCRADLGDSRCDVSLGAVTSTGSITSVTSKSVFADSAQSATGLMYGLMTWATGAANAGLSMEVKSYATGGAFELAEPMRYIPATGDGYSVYTGCNRLPTTCKTVYSNLANMRAEIFLTGSDELLKFGRQ